ncbi:unnamed protein product [Aphanomyces euteiches]
MGADSTLQYTSEHVRESCAKWMAEKAKHVTINEEKIPEFVASLDKTQFEHLAEPIRYPLAFRSMEDEVNFMAIVDLLNFGSGYRKPLHKYCDRGAHETMMFGVIGMYISEPRLDAAFLQGLSIDSVANYFSLPLDRDEELSTGIYISKPGPLKPLAEGIHKVLTETGKLCKEHGASDLGAFILAQLKDEPPRAAVIVDALATTFPGFRDVHGEVLVLKKAQLLASNLYRRFGESHAAHFRFVDLPSLTAFSDNVLPCVLNAIGILEYTPALTTLIQSGELLPCGGEQEVELRAGAIVACDKILAALRIEMPAVTIMELYSYLWRVGKEPAYRSIERHATQDTILY